MTIVNAMSDYKQISCAILQGSVLRPLLFLLCINDFNNSSNQLDFHPFADDTNLFYADKSLLELETTVNNELFEVFSWLCADKLSVNSGAPPSGAPYSYEKQKETHELIFSWLSWLAVLLVGAYARRRRRRRRRWSRARWLPYSK